MATVATNTIALNVSGNAGQELSKLQTNVEKLTKSFEGLKSALNVAAMTAFAASAIKFADDMQDLANATGIATNAIVGLSKTFQQNGGNAEQARNAILKLSQSIGDASDGSNEAMLAFKRVGVTLDDLQRASEQDIMEKTIQGLAKIGDASLRLKTAVDLLGKGAKGIDFTGVAAGYKSASEEAKKYNDAIKASAELNDKFEAAVGKLKLSFLKTFEPIANAINKLDDEKLNKLIESFVQMAVALTSLAASAKVLALLGEGMAALFAWTKLVGPGIASLTKTFSAWGTRIAGLSADIAAGTGVFVAFGKHISIMASKTIPYLVSGLGMVAKGFLGWAGVIWLVNDAIDLMTGKGLIGWLDNAYEKTKQLLGLKSELDQQPAAVIAPDNIKLASNKAHAEDGAKRVAANERTQKSLLDQEKRFADMRSAIALNNALYDADEIKTIQLTTANEIAKAKKDIAEKYSGMPDKKINQEQQLKGMELQSKANLEIYRILKQRNIESEKFTHSLEQQGDAYKEELRFTLQQLDNANSLVMVNGELTNISEDQLAIEKAKLQMSYGQRSAVQDLQKQIQNLDLDTKLGVGNPAENAKRIKLLSDAIVRLQQINNGYVDDLGSALQRELSIKMIQEDRIRTTQNLTKAIEDQIARQQALGSTMQSLNDKKVDLRFEQSTIGMDALAKQYVVIQEEARKAGLEASRAFAASFGDMELTKEQASELAIGLAKIASQYKQIADIQTQSLTKNVELAERIKNTEILNKAIDDQISRTQTLGNIMQGLNDKKVDLQFNTDQMTKTPLQKQIAQIQEEARKGALEAGRAFAASFGDMELNTAQAKELADGLGQIANKYKEISDAQIKNLEQSRSWDQGWSDAFNSFMDNATNSARRANDAFNVFTSNMNSEIDRFVDTGKSSFEDFANSIIKDFIKIELKAQATKALSVIGGTGGLLSGIGSLFGFAEGGNPPINKPSIVGEKGPELFIPRTAGTIVPNGAGAGVVNKTYITNNISAIDSRSVAQMFAENRKALLGTVQLAQKELPYGNR